MLRPVSTVCLLVAAAATVVPATAAHAATYDTTLVSRASDGAAANGNSGWDFPGLQSAISADGRFVAFTSDADNLSGEDDDAFTNVFVRDRQAGTTTLVSRSDGDAGAAAAGDSVHPSISADGRFVAFSSVAANLSNDDTDDCTDWYWGGTVPCSNVFVRDLQTGATTFVSRAAGVSGAAGNGSSFTPSISPDGNLVAFISEAENLSDQDGNECYGYTDLGDPYPIPCPNIFVRDLRDGATRYLAAASQWQSSCGAAFSDDGRYVAIETGNVEVVDLQTGTTVVASRKDGAQGEAAGGWCPSLSSDGRVVAFVAYNSLSDGSGGGGVIWHEVYVRELDTGRTSLVSRHNWASGTWNKYSNSPSISGDGSYVAFSSADTDLVPNEAAVFVRDRQTNSLTLVSRASGNAGAAGSGGTPSMSRDGQFVAFQSGADGLSDEDNNAYENVYTRELGLAAAEPLTADLSVALTVTDTTPTVGNDVTFTVTVANHGPDGATGVRVSEWLGPGWTFQSATSTQGTYDPGPGGWNVGDLAAGTDATLRIVAEPTTAEQTTNTAQVVAADQPDPDSAPANDDPAEDDQASVTVTAQPSCPAATAGADRDSWVSQNTPSTTRGTETTMRVRSKPGAHARALVRFTLPPVPAGCEVTSATLRLYASSATSGRTLQAYTASAPWSESTVTWNNRPGTTGTPAATASGVGWRQWTVTTQVKAMYGTNNGFLIRDASESGSGPEQVFNSRQNATNKPELTITFGPS